MLYLLCLYEKSLIDICGLISDRFNVYHYSCHIFHLAYNEKFISYMDKNNNFFYWNNNNPLYYRYADAIFNDYYFSKFY